MLLSLLGVARAGPSQLSVETDTNLAIGRTNGRSPHFSGSGLPHLIKWLGSLARGENIAQSLYKMHVTDEK